MYEYVVCIVGIYIVMCTKPLYKVNTLYKSLYTLCEVYKYFEEVKIVIIIVTIMECIKHFIHTNKNTADYSH